MSPSPATAAPAPPDADRALPKHGRARSGRVWAWVALVAIAVFVVVVVLQALASPASLGHVLLAATVVLVVGPIVSWFALTTRSAWKRLLSLAVGVAAVAGLAVAVVAFSMAQIGGLVVIVACAWAVRASARLAAPGISTPARRVPLPMAPACPWLLVNPWSGSGTAGRVGLAEAAAAAGFDVHVMVAGDDPAALARQAAADGADALAVAGGDGTLAQVAAVALELDLPFLCVPAGTRNHFARDLRLNREDPLAALKAVDGPELRVDAAFVGGRLFLNNVSLGAYAEVVSEARYRTHKLDTSRVVVRRLVRGEREPLDVSVRNADGRTVEHVQVLQVANNRYQLRSLSRFGARDRLDAGLLQVSALLTRKGSDLAGLAARAALGRRQSAAVWSQWDAPALTVHSRLPSLAAGVDGEAVRLPVPLEFRVLPRALRVLVPPGIPPWVEARHRGQAIPQLWRLATGRALSR